VLRLPLQIALTLLLGLFPPVLLYAAWDVAVLDITGIVYLCLIVAMLGTAILIMIEGFLALRRIDPPEQPGAPYPTASAVIAAYLPNESATVIETVEAFLRLEYPGELQVILAYNTPRDMPVEATLQEIARRDPRFLPRRVDASTSKAQNVNAALTEVTGEFVGVFDADHHPDPDSFSRAWRWLSNGYDIVQGHCLVRNGDASWVARMVAVEFEAMYAVSHPGRARLHGFGVFGGSNGYWKTDLLLRTRMHGFMLTEDIDSSIRVVEAGYKIASDPYLVSRELAPVTMKALWHQRLRWAQGWFQVSYKHIDRGLKSPRLTLRQKLGMLHLLGWRELFPWLSLQILPILFYWVWWRGDRLNWFVWLFVLTTLVMLSNQPAQICFAYRLADPEIRRRKGWFWFYLGASVLFYMEFKNLISRVAQIKEMMRERRWVVTPRTRKKER
jgi:cellulose synthase/poly-beta-1,6-N-acetylglucosamine synthase-like glycosyltransferase